MDVTGVISLVRDIALIIAMFLSAGLAVFVFVQFAPKLQLRITPRWADEAKSLLVLKLEVENNSVIRVHKQKIRLQILEHEIPAHGCLSEWVPFAKEAILPQEQPKEWHDPIEIFVSTKYLNPGEVLSVERLCRCPQDSILHVGFQAEVKLGALGRLSAWLRSWDERWTSTIIAIHTSKKAYETPLIEQTGDTASIA